jgi:hypothetical protein
MAFPAMAPVSAERAAMSTLIRMLHTLFFLGSCSIMFLVVDGMFDSF